MSRHVRILILVVVACAGAACVPAAPTEKVIQYDPLKTKMGQIQQRGTIIVGVPDDFYPFGYTAGKTPGFSTRNPEGFTVGLGQLVAAALGVKTQFLAMPSSQLFRAVDSNRVDLVFPMVPITEAALAVHPFSDPYYVGHQELLVPRGSSIQQVDDVGANKVCSAINPHTELPLTRLDTNIALLPVSSATECARRLRDGRAVAATGSDVALFGLKQRLPGSAIVGDELTTEGYGAAASACDPGFAEFVSRVFADARNSGQWTSLYKKWVLPASGASTVPAPPDLTVVDASDLYPLTGPAPSLTPIACPTPET